MGSYIRERHDDEERPIDALVLHEVCDERDGLDRLPQPHLISQDAIQVVVIQGHQPLQTLDLKGQKYKDQVHITHMLPVATLHCTVPWTIPFFQVCLLPALLTVKSQGTVLRMTLYNSLALFAYFFMKAM